MAGLMTMLRKTLRKGTRAVRFVGKKTTNVLKKGTNAVGLTRKAKSVSRKNKRNSKSKSKSKSKD